MTPTTRVPRIDVRRIRGGSSEAKLILECWNQPAAKNHHYNAVGRLDMSSRGALGEHGRHNPHANWRRLPLPVDGADFFLGDERGTQDAGSSCGDRLAQLVPELDQFVAKATHVFDIHVDVLS